MTDKPGLGPARGPGTYSIGSDLIEGFMEKNDLQYIIRAHEPEINKKIEVAENKYVVTIMTARYFGERAFFSLPAGEVMILDD